MILARELRAKDAAMLTMAYMQYIFDVSTKGREHEQLKNIREATFKKYSTRWSLCLRIFCLQFCKDCLIAFRPKIKLIEGVWKCAFYLQRWISNYKIWVVISNFEVYTNIWKSGFQMKSKSKFSNKLFNQIQNFKWNPGSQTAIHVIWLREKNQTYMLNAHDMKRIRNLRCISGN